LDVDTEPAIGLPADDAARREAVGFSLVPDATVAVCEQAARDEVAGFAEVVPAAAAGQLDLAELVARFAKQRLLLDHIRQIGVVRIVVKAEPVVRARRNSGAESSVDERV